MIRVRIYIEWSFILVKFSLVVVVVGKITKKFKNFFGHFQKEIGTLKKYMFRVRDRRCQKKSKNRAEKKRRKKVIFGNI